MRSFRLFTALACASAFAVSAVPALAGASVAPVRIKSLTIARPVLPATGGATVLRMSVANGATCWITAPPAVRVNRAHRGCAHGRMATVVRLAPIDSLRAAHFRILAWVHGRDGRTIRRAVLLAERGLAPVQAGFSPTTRPVLGKAYSQHLTATGGRRPYSWALAGGTLPPGLRLSASGVLSGTPTSTGNYSANVKVTDASVPLHFTKIITVALSVAPPPLAATSSQLPHGAVGQPYSATLVASGGIAPYRWSVSSGALPTGVALSADGHLTGTPTAAGTFTAVVQVLDSSPSVQRATESIAIVISPPPLSVAPVLPTAYVGKAYSVALGTAGGTAPYKWSVTSGALPSGLTLSANGVISGTPTAAGTFRASLQVTDSSNPAASVTTDVTLTVATSLVITTTSVPATATTNPPYTSFTFQAAGGAAPYTWSWAASGTSGLPPGMSLSSTGVLSGTPTKSGTYSFIVVVTDSSSPLKLVAEKGFSLSVS